MQMRTRRIDCAFVAAAQLINNLIMKIIMIIKTRQCPSKAQPVRGRNAVHTIYELRESGRLSLALLAGTQAANKANRSPHFQAGIPTEVALVLPRSCALGLPCSTKSERERRDRLPEEEEEASERNLITMICVLGRG